MKTTLVFLALAVRAYGASLEISPVWSAHPVEFDLLTHGDRQFVAFYDDQRRMTVAARKLSSPKWEFVRLPSQLVWDSHNYVVLAVDRDGYLHLSGNMHAVPLVYFRTTRPLDINTFEAASMVGSEEQQVTYPHWLRAPAGDLVFTYRDGRSGSGNEIYNVYDEKSKKWRRLLDAPLTDGQGHRNAYPVGPMLGPDGYFHLVWTWRDTPDCSTNHDLSYARSKDLVHWETSGGVPFRLPVRLETAEIIDRVPVRGGMINGNTKIGFDSQKRVVVTYHKFDTNGNTQIYNARREADGWHIYQASDWAWRWYFEGGGSIPFEITHGAVQTLSGGRLRLDWHNAKYGSGAWELDEATMKVLGPAPALDHVVSGPPAQLESDLPGMMVRTANDSGTPPPGTRYALRWETLGPNRDLPRQPPLPGPSMLRLYEFRVPVPAHTAQAFGSIRTDRSQYRPLDRVRVRIEGRGKGDAVAIVRVADADQKQYFEKEVALSGNRGEVEFTAAGGLGMHYVYLFFPGERRHSRYLNFRLDAETAIESGDRDFDLIYPLTRERMPLGRREYQTPRGKFVGYISADTNHFDGIWLRDWMYGMGAYKHWERDLECGLDRFLEVQREDGQVPDGIERDGRTWRVGLESDVEYILTLGVWQTWQATGDDAWMRAALPRLEKALRYIMSDPKSWDAAHRLIQRQHSCDTWDYDIDGASDMGTSRHVIATCDQSGYALAFRAMSAMYRHLGDAASAARWAKEAAEYRQRAVALLWDGGKFQHHVHLDPSINHGDFDETRQLAMGNTWAMTRGLADAGQAAKIIDEYRRRQRETGDAYPWWSLQPGYPDRLNYWKEDFRKEGGYANGGLMPWVGGELAHAAFQFSRENYGVELVRQYAGLLRRTGGAQVWYWPDGTPGHRTPNEVDYAGWGMAQWVDALVEGLAGIHDTEAQLRAVELTPRWLAAGVKQVRATVRYPLTNAYISYRLTREGDQVTLEYSGSSSPASIRVLLPEEWKRGYAEPKGPYGTSGTVKFAR